MRSARSAVMMTWAGNDSVFTMIWRARPASLLSIEATSVGLGFILWGLSMVRCEDAYLCLLAYRLIGRDTLLSLLSGRGARTGEGEGSMSSTVTIAAADYEIECPAGTHYASWKMHVMRSHGWSGCPLGRGATAAAALRDLIGRTETEQAVRITLAPPRP